ncbi:MAG TPA: hypothetical protein VFD19_02665 [Clostridia bacterium]|nr:hypothetical protein [Clostridia bacterium]
MAFRRRFPAEAMAEINEAIIQGAKSDTPQDPDEPQNPPTCSDERDENDQMPAENKGTLILDATCAPANIHFLTDTGFLNKARESSEKLIDALWTPTPGEKNRGRIGMWPVSIICRWPETNGLGIA